jgi:hypothetical protein
MLVAVLSSANRCLLSHECDYRIPWQGADARSRVATAGVLLGLTAVPARINGVLRDCAG